MGDSGFHQAHGFPYWTVITNALIGTRDDAEADRLALVAVGVEDSGRRKPLLDVFELPSQIECILNASVRAKTIEWWMPYNDQFIPLERLRSVLYLCTASPRQNMLSLE